jgi:hypothetical protein
VGWRQSEALAGRRFHSIVFQFPHIAGPPRMHLNRRLLAGFFSSGVALLHGGGTMQVSLAAGQGGTPADSKAQREWGNSWQLTEMAAAAGLVLVAAPVFQASDWEKAGYRSRGHRRGVQGERAFRTEGAVSHCVMEWTPALGDALWPPSHEHHVSFWLPSPWPTSPPGVAAHDMVGLKLLRMLLSWCSVLALACDPGGGVAAAAATAAEATAAADKPCAQCTKAEAAAAVRETSSSAEQRVRCDACEQAVHTADSSAPGGYDKRVWDTAVAKVVAAVVQEERWDARTLVTVEPIAKHCFWCVARASTSWPHLHVLTHCGTCGHAALSSEPPALAPI